MSGAPSADLLSQPRPDVTLAPRRRVEAQTPFDTRLQRARAKFDKAASGIKDKFTSAKKGAPPEINLRPEETALEELGQEDPFAGLFKEGAVKRPAPRPVTIDERARNDRDPTRHATRGSRRGRRLTATGLAATAALYAAPFSPYSPLRGSGSTDMVRDQTTLQIRSSPAGNENSVIESKKTGDSVRTSEIEIRDTPYTHAPIPNKVAEAHAFDISSKAQEDELFRRGQAERDPDKQQEIFAEWRATKAANSKKNAEYSEENKPYRDAQVAEGYITERIKRLEGRFAAGMRLPNGLMINIYESSVGTGTQREVIIDPEALRDVVDRTLLAYSQLPASEFTPFAQKARERAESGDLKDSITTFVINTRDNTCFKMDKFGNYETARFIDQAPLPPPAQPGTIATVYDRQNSGCDAIGIQTHGDSNNSLIAVSGPISYPDSLPPPTSVLDTFIHELLHMNLSHGGRVERQDTDLGNREHAKYVNPGTSAVAREYHQSIEAGKSRSPFSYSGPIRPGGVSNKSNIIVSRR